MDEKVVFDTIYNHKDTVKKLIDDGILVTDLIPM